MKHNAARIGLLVVMALFMVSMVVTPVHAAIYDHDGTIGKGEVIDDDVFLSGNEVVVDGTVNGILFAAGNSVTINGTVNGDVFATARTVTIANGAKIDGNLFTGAEFITLNGQVSGSAMGGSAALTLGEKGQVGRNFFFGGYSLETRPETVVGRDVYTATYQTILNGEVKRNLYSTSAAVELNGKVGGDARIDLGDVRVNNEQGSASIVGEPGMPAAVQPGLRISDKASIGGKLAYTSSISQAETIKGIPADRVTFKTPVPSKHEGSAPVPARVVVQPPLLTWFFDFMRDLIALLVFGGLALWLMPAVSQKVIVQAHDKTLPTLGYGFVVVIIGYAAAFVALGIIFSVGILLAILTLGALSGPVFGLGLSSLGLFFAVFTFLIGTGSKVVVSILIGQIFMSKVAPNSPNQKLWALLSGTLIYVLVHSIPFVGWIVALAATAIGVGAMWLAIQSYRKERGALPEVSA